MANEAPTYHNLVSAFTDFLTVAIHTILYERKIYPQTSFLSARKYNFAVRQSRHPKVCEWINDAVNAVETQLLKGAVDRVAVVMYTKTNHPVERFMFDVSRFPVVSPTEVDLPLRRAPIDGGDEAILPYVDLEEQFRATMSKLGNCGAKLESLPLGCTFTIAIELKDDGLPPLSHPQAWMPVEPTDIDSHRDAATEKHSLPVRTVAAGELVFEAWIEELTVP